jgi:hypothetical protein
MQEDLQRAQRVIDYLTTTSASSDPSTGSLSTLMFSPSENPSNSCTHISLVSATIAGKGKTKITL